MAGNIITPSAEDSYSIVKFGAGLLELRGTANQGLISGGGYGLEDLVVNDGTLRLQATFSDQFLRNDTGSLTMNGGAFELFGSANRSTTQNFVGAFTAGAGASIIRVANTGNVDTRLNLQDSTSPTKVNFQKGSSLLFVEDHNGTGNAIISLAGQFGTDVQVVLPRATYRTGIDVQNPGVNYFAFVDGNGYDVIASDNISIGGANAHTIRGNLADWETFMNVMDGALSSTAFYGVTNSNASVNTIRFYNSDFSRAARFTSGNTEVTNIDTTNLVVGQVVRANENILPFGTTFTIISIDTANNKIVLSAPAQATSTTDRLLIPDLHKSTITISDTLNVVGGAILQTTHAGNHVNSITGGLLTSGLNNSDGASADLIIHNWNPQLPLTISSTIGNNPTSGRKINLVHTGDGTTALAGTNTYTGETFLQGGVLRLDSLLALPSDNITYLDGGVIGLNYSGTFNRGLSDPAIVNPATAGRVRWTSSGGFAAYGAERTVSINGDNTTPLVWGSGGFVPDNDSLILGAQDSDNRLVFANAIDLGRKDRMVQVVSGRSGTIAEARLSGVITSDGGSLIKVGTGTLEITNDNANHNGGIVLAEGTLVNASGLAAAQRAFGTGTVSIGTTTDTRSVGAHLTLDLRPTQSINMANNIVVGSANHSGLSMVQLENNIRVTALSGFITLNRPTGRNFLVQTGGTTTNVALSGAISGTGGFTVNGGGTVTLSGTVPNTYGTLATAPSPAFDGSTVIRAGTLRVTSSGALSGGAIELGDATTALASVARATSGASVLGTDRDTVSFSADNRESLGGAFVSNANGLFDASGGFLTFPNAFGAFYNVSTTIDGLSFAPGSEGTRILVKDEIENPERNGIYTITRFNADGTMNLARTADFSSTANMTYGSQVAVTAGSSAGVTFFNAAPTVTARNTPETGHNFWVRDTVNPAVTLTIDGPSVGTISQPIDVNATSTGAITIRATSAVTNGVTFSGPVTLQDVNVGAADVKTLNLDSAAAGLGMIFSGPVGQSVSGAADDVLSLAKSGTGGVALSGSNTYKGGTTVTQGSLFVNNTSGSGTGSGGITVSSGATLAGSGIIAPAAGVVTISIPTGANLSVGGPADTVGQALTLNLQQDNILNLAGNLRLDLFSNLPGSSTASEGDRLLFGNSGVAQVNLTGSTLMVNNAGSLTFNAGDSWKIIDWGTIFRDNTIFTGLDPLTNQYNNNVYLPALSGGLAWNIGDLYTLGTITVAVPEPSRLLMLMFGLIALGFRRRRKSLQA
jgi:autotransporter-associated beta strand protein